MIDLRGLFASAVTATAKDVVKSSAVDVAMDVVKSSTVDMAMEALVGHPGRTDRQGGHRDNRYHRSYHWHQRPGK